MPPKTPNLPKRVQFGGKQGRTGRGISPHRTDPQPTGIMRGKRNAEAMEADGSSDSSGVDQEALDAQLPTDDERNQNLFKETVWSDDPKIGTENNGKDEALFREIEKLKVALDKLAKGVPEIPVSRRESFVKDLLIDDNQELIRYIGCLVLGGSRGTWCKLLGQKDSRRAIVIGVIARALKEHVFGEYLFGGDESTQAKLMKIDTSGKYHCGFERTRERAKLVNAYKIEDGTLQSQIASVHSQLAKLLAPLWSVDLHPEALQHLEASIEIAAKTAELIRNAPDVVYYWPPAFKDEEFEPARMEASNLTQMIENSPYDKKNVGGYHRAVLKDPKSTATEAIVRIVAFPGIVAYRQYGGKLALAEIADEKKKGTRNQHHAPEIRDRYNNVVTAAQGFRSRLINKSVVHLEWGQQRLLTKEAGTSAHLDAVRDGKTESRYKDNSAETVELWDMYSQANPDEHAHP